MNLNHLSIGAGILFILSGCSGPKMTESVPEIINTHSGISGLPFQIEFTKGKNHNHPTFAFWLEDLEGNYRETLYVTKSLGTGIYGHGRPEYGKWNSTPGPSQNPSSLPYWLHKRKPTTKDKILLPTPDYPVPDAITAATPKGDFVLNSVSPKELPTKFRLLLEINQPWDWNEYWHNERYPGEPDYNNSCQPSLVYAVTIDLDDSLKEYYMNPIGHGHYAGKDGRLYTDLSTFTTALHIVDKVKVVIHP
ncbi:MAG TPA: hypothetical protein PLK12_11965 [Prolixibacteraceae bacterium]|nr:hypothetical protein [Prolixibacteraceae bacterium]